MLNGLQTQIRATHAMLTNAGIQDDMLFFNRDGWVSVSEHKLNARFTFEEIDQMFDALLETGELETRVSAASIDFRLDY